MQYFWVGQSPPWDTISLLGSGGRCVSRLFFLSRGGNFNFVQIRRSFYPSLNMDKLPLGWSRVGLYVYYRQGGGISSYDEAGLRLCISEYISNSSRARFANDGRFCDDKMFFDGLKYLMTGLELFFVDSERPEA